MSRNQKYTLKIDLNVLNHLGLNLYSNVSAVLSELIANAWDADATEVRLDIDKKNKSFTVTDNGCGMDQESLNNKFLNVGYERRRKIDHDGKEQIDDLTPVYKRKVMGRKGIGKLSVFSIAENIKVYSKIINKEIVGIELKTSEIKDAIKNKNDYHPVELKDNFPNKLEKSGTVIKLRELKKRVYASLDTSIRKRIARRFNIFSEEFKVFINNEEITPKDSDYINKVEYVLTYGDFDSTQIKDKSKVTIEKRESEIYKDMNYYISGWIGLVKHSGDLQEKEQNYDENLNKIIILTRGKVSLEDILELYREGGLYTKFLIGEISADFLDISEADDIATTNRQDYIQEDERFKKLKDFIHRELKYLEKKRQEYKAEKALKDATAIPAIRDWYEGLSSHLKRDAKELFRKIASVVENLEQQKILYKHGIIAFEYLSFKDQLDSLHEIDDNKIEVFLKTFSELNIFEASLYYSITTVRLKVIKKLMEIIDTDQLEKVIKDFLYQHLWLLDPSWERATDEKETYKEKQIKTLFTELDAELNEDEKNARFDIMWKKLSGKYVIIELKRASVTPVTLKLIEQVSKYIDALESFLKSPNVPDPNIEAICIVGKLPSKWEKSTKVRKIEEEMLKIRGIRLITYTELISDAERSYSLYLEKHKESGRLQKILTDIDKFEIS